jgi:hypothetical protein
MGEPAIRYPAGTCGRPPRGVREVTCTGCGTPVWLARLSESSKARAGYHRSAIPLEPACYAQGAGGGNIEFNGDGYAVFTGRFPGRYVHHQCPARVVACKHCRAPVRVLNQPPGEPERLAVVDADEDPGGAVVVGEHCWAVHDPRHVMQGARYRWHKHDDCREGSPGA